jgi:3-ketosteroid 9alpha-monooxygenase subunit A
MAKTADYGLGPYTFPRGWFMIADAAALDGGRTLPLRFFGRDFVLYRGKDSGKPVLLDAYCPHTGAHLARSRSGADTDRVMGDTIRCPLHGWRFGDDGQCVHIPNADAADIPSTARVKAWPVTEGMGAIFVWHDPAGGEPDYPVPHLTEWDDPSWVRWKFDDCGILNSHPVEVVDNIVDHAHQAPIHGQAVTYFEVEFDGHHAKQREGGNSRTALSEDGSLLTIDATYHGPAILLTAMGGQYPSYFLIAHTPVDDGAVQVWHATLVKSQNTVATADDVAMARAFQAASLAAFMQDFEVWSAKRPAVEIMRIPADGPYGQNRKWYRQFYVPREEGARLAESVRGTYGVPGVPRAPA